MFLERKLNHLISGPFKILYVTPERLAKSKRFMNALQKCYLAKRLHMIAVDEGNLKYYQQNYQVLRLIKMFFIDFSSLHQPIWKRFSAGL